MKVYVKENKLYIKEGFWFTHKAKEMPEELENKFVPVFNYKIFTATAFRAPEGVTEIRTNISGVFYDDDADRPQTFSCFSFTSRKNTSESGRRFCLSAANVVLRHRQQPKRPEPTLARFKRRGQGAALHSSLKILFISLELLFLLVPFFLSGRVFCVYSDNLSVLLLRILVSI